MAARPTPEPPEFATVRAIALALPGVTEGTSYGTPAFRVGKTFLTRLHQDGAAIVLRVGFDERAMLMEADPASFFITEHYRAYPAMLVRLATVPRPVLERLLVERWRAAAPRRAVAAYDAGR
ncbi:MAG TPA: MmcQ/YjbR family DNA-binding protein [Hyphomicrobiales bacterium]|nr:MmcQ/YjbR family DNA-binding protein [Hyphomicrobiales bacterium]